MFEFIKRWKEKRLATYWNAKYPLTIVNYVAREDKIRFDVRNFITYPDNVLKEIFVKNHLQGKDDDETVWNIMRFVQQYVTYETDAQQFGFNEEWDFPAEVIFNKRADCEGGGHLMVSLWRSAGIPAFRCKEAVGWVIDNNEKKYHSYPLYLASDNEWRQMDWCFYPETTKVLDRIKAKDNPKYGYIEFTFNDEWSWGEHSIEIDGGLKNGI